VSEKALLTSSYDFYLPDELIASYPADPRDSAKLLVYDRATDTITHTHFSEFEKFIPQDTALIFNNTKVIKARLFGKKQTGGKVELLINKPLDATKINVFIKGRVKTSTEILFDENLTCKVMELYDDGSRVVNFFRNNQLLRFEDLLLIVDKIGHIPLPPYIQRADEKQDAVEYQSVFASKDGAVAAPTASLHFTQTQHQRVCKTFKHGFVTLHVGSGTFKPVECDIITKHPMHSEYFHIPQDSLKLLESDTKILSIGTTSTRTIEFWARNKDKTEGEANLFLHPNNRPIRVDHLLTNFHLPKSTLLMLVASFIGLEKTHQLYTEAIKENYRFYSYGDAMLIL